MKGSLLYTLDCFVSDMLYRLFKKEREERKTCKLSNIEHVKETALRWKNCSYEYKRIHALVDWEKGEKIGHKACKGTFFKKSFLISKEKEAATVASASNNTDENTTIEHTTSIHSICKSSRKLTQYKSSLDGRNCIICNGIKYEKGRKVSLLSMTLRKHGKGNHHPEETLTKFANIHIQNDTKYKDAAQRMILQQNVRLYLQLMVPIIKIVINHFVVHVEKDHHKNQNLTKLHTMTKALNFSNFSNN